MPIPNNEAFGIPTSLNVGGRISAGQAPASADEVPRKLELDAVDAALTLAINNETAARIAADANFVSASTVSAMIGAELAQRDNKDSCVVAVESLPAVGSPTLADGVEIELGKSVLLFNSGSAEANGPYVLTPTGWQRRGDSDAATELTAGAIWYIEQGTWQDREFRLLVNVQVLGVDPVNITQVAVAESYTAGNGMALVGNQFRLNAPNDRTVRVVSESAGAYVNEFDVFRLSFDAIDRRSRIAGIAETNVPLVPAPTTIDGVAVDYAFPDAFDARISPYRSYWVLKGQTNSAENGAYESLEVLGTQTMVRIARFVGAVQNAGPNNGRRFFVVGSDVLEIKSGAAKFVQALPVGVLNGATGLYETTVTHNLGTQDFCARMRVASDPDANYIPHLKIVDNNTVTFGSLSNWTASDYVLTLVG